MGFVGLRVFRPGVLRLALSPLDDVNNLSGFEGGCAGAVSFLRLNSTSVWLTGEGNGYDEAD